MLQWGDVLQSAGVGGGGVRQAQGAGQAGLAQGIGEAQVEALSQEGGQGRVPAHEFVRGPSRLCKGGGLPPLATAHV